VYANKKTLILVDMNRSIKVEHFFKQNLVTKVSAIFLQLAFA